MGGRDTSRPYRGAKIFTEIIALQMLIFDVCGLQIRTSVVG